MREPFDGDSSEGISVPIRLRPKLVLTGHWILHFHSDRCDLPAGRYATLACFSLQRLLSPYGSW